jgi:hypothetical protein
MPTLSERLAALEDGDRHALHTILHGLQHVSVPQLSLAAVSLMAKRPLTAMRTLAWITTHVAEPGDRVLRDEWLKVHNNACYLAVFHGEPEERRAIVARALHVAPANPPIFHNAACVLCKLGDLDAALDAIRRGVASGYDDVTIASIREDDDLAPIRGEAFDAILARADTLALPAWAEGYTAAAYSQFRESVRTILPDPDLSTFDDGFVAWADPSSGFERVFDLRELAAECRGVSAIECTEIVHRHFHALFHH